MFGPCFVVQYLVSFDCSFAVFLRRRRQDCFTLIAFLVACGCYCFVTLPHSAVSWSAVCDCSISWSYSLFLRHGSVCMKSVPLEML